MGAGSSAEGVKNKSEEIVETNCIVKFRPCKDWRGEYGFDWVREGENDFYKERISSIDYSDVSYLNAIEYMKQKLGDKYEEWEENIRELLEEPRRKEKEAYVTKKVTYLRFTESEQEKFDADLRAWQVETDKKKKNAMLEDLVKRKAKADPSIQQFGEPKFMDDELYEQCEMIIIGTFAKTEMMKDDNVDRKAWWHNNALRINESDMEMDKGKPPFEYFIAPNRVRNVTYKIDRKQFGNIWTSEVTPLSIANGSEEASGAKLKLGSFLRFYNGGKLSLKKDGDNYSIPFYTENGSEQLPYQKKVRFERQEGAYSLTYQKVIDANGIGKIKLWVDFIEKGKIGIKYKLYYEDGFFRFINISSHHDNWKTINQIDAQKRKDIIWINQNVITPGRALNTAMNIDDLLKDDSIDNVQLTIESGVQDYKEYNLSDGLTKDDQGHVKYKGLPIFSWEESYEDTFTPFIYKMGDAELQRYCVPVLSISHGMIERTRFTFNTQTDAPKTEEIKGLDTFSYPLQIESNAEKAVEIQFESNPEKAISVEPSSVSCPKGKKIHEITIKYNSNLSPVPFIPTKVIVNVRRYEDGKPKEIVGKLMVRVNSSVGLSMLCIKVFVKGADGKTKAFSQDLLDSIEDQKKALQNSLSQVGVKIHFFDGSICIKESEIKDMYDEETKEWDFSNQSDRIVDLFFKAFLKKYKSLEPYYKWYYYAFIFDTDGKTFKDSTSAYSYHYTNEKYPKVKFEYNVYSGSIMNNRTAAYTFSHELLHNLGNPHTYQFKNDVFSFPFCFEFASSSDVMDYYTLRYSLHKYQWDNMLNVIRSKVMDDKDIKKALLAERIRQEKRDREFAEKMRKINAGFGNRK